MAHIWAFGANHCGQLGVDIKCTDSTPLPFMLQLPPNVSPNKIATGKTFSIMSCENNPALIFYGMQDIEQKNRLNSASDQTKTNTQTFEKLKLPPDLETTGSIEELAVGDTYATILSKNGTLFCCGNLENDVCTVEERKKFTSVKPVELLTSHQIISVSIGVGHVIASSSSGTCFTWGNNHKGQLGIGSDKPFFSDPQKLDSLFGIPVKQVVAGGYHSFVLSISGALFSFGDNSSGQLGLGDENDREFPCLVKFLRSQFIMFMSAGLSHSAALTADGGVFTFGSCRFGQLGHSSMTNESTPRKVLELMGSNVVQIACGNNHTLALDQAATPRLYTFGLGTFGQLGLSSDSFVNSSVPVLARAVMSVIEKANPRNQYIRRIFAGGDSCFVITDTKSEANAIDFTTANTFPTVHHLDIGLVKEMMSYDSKRLENVLTCIFRNAACLNASFLLPGNDHFKCSVTNPGVNMAEARRGWHALLTADRTVQSLKNKPDLVSLADFVFNLIFEALLPSLKKNPPDVEALRLYLILPTSARFDNPGNFTSLQCPFAAAVVSLERPADRVLQRWWAKIHRDDFFRLVLAYKKCCMHIINVMATANSTQLLNPIAAHQSGKSFDSESRNNLGRVHLSLEMLKRLSLSNEELRGDDRLECEDFYIPEIRELVNVREAYIAWWHTRKTAQHESLFNLCNYPFIFDGVAKSLLLQTDAGLQMHYAVIGTTQARMGNIFLPFGEMPFLIVEVDRHNVVHNAITQLSVVSRRDYKKPMKVSFIGEEGDDAGGVKKEFFMLLFREVFDAKYGMFRSDETSRLNWFNDILADEESLSMYRFIGLLCGLAIYNSIIVDISFPMALFKKLLKKPCTLADLKELSPTVGRSLESLLEFDGPGSVEDVFGLMFEITRTCFDATETVELVTGGRNKQVTAENRTEYVTAYVDYIFNKSVEQQFSAFMKGFELVCGCENDNFNVFSLFHPSELQAMVIGNENYDWAIFEKAAEYKGDFDAKHSVVRMFWEVFHNLSLSDKKKFLLFLTGCDRIPIIGMQDVKITIQPLKVTDTFLPVAHTCFNILDLPLYKDKATLQEKLLLAIQHTQGFGIA